jgi:hypothetical protein
MNKLTYDIVQDKEMADYMEDILRSGGIDLKVHESKPYYDSILGDIDSMLKYEILLSANDFKYADSILLAALQKENYTDNHLLNQLSNEELTEMVQHPDKKGRVNVLTAKIILGKRGINIESGSLLEETGDYDESAPADISRSLSSASKILLVIASISGFGFIIMGIGGVIVGLFLNRFKVHNSQGEYYFCFDKNTREFGLVLVILSIIVFLITWFFLNNYF